ncbi:MAG: GNAT family N-acetyltransferase [Alphaproteobacteria bacterium]|nr:MAG: GNAT family N-acetyltransferase [Alphaproteobacteria bacterium]
MSIRHLDRLFAPKSIALIGASRKPHSVGAVLARNLFSSGFAGPIMPVNPHETAINGALCYKEVSDLPIVPDLAVVATPPDTVPGLIGKLGEMGCRSAVVLTAGFGEGTDAAQKAEGEKRVEAMLHAAKPHLLRIVGPNCLGIAVPGVGLNATFAHVTPQKGDVALVTQSGAVATALLDWAASHGIGFSHVVSMGDMSDVDFGDMLDYLAADSSVRAILLYVEHVTHARKFMSAARAAARSRPVIVVKSGRTALAQQAAASHTGALAGSDEVYDAAFRRAGMLRVHTLADLFGAAEILARARRPNGDRLAVLTNGGGLGVMAVDAMAGEAVQLANLAPETVEKLNRVLPPTWSHANPVDIIGDAGPERYRAALDTLMDAPEVDGVLVLNCPTALAESDEAAGAVVASTADRPADGRKTVLTSWLGDHTAVKARKVFATARLPTFTTPEDAVRGFGQLSRFRRNQMELLQTPKSVEGEFDVDLARARGPVELAVGEGRKWLDEADAKQVLKAFGVPVVETRKASDPNAVAAVAAQIHNGGRLAIKILSPDILHKSDVGGVALDLVSPGAAADAARAMLERVKRIKPEARIDGFTVQQMVSKPMAHELICGITVDPTFGPVVMFGKGGVAVEVIRDTQLALPPLNMTLARELMERTRVWRQLQGYRGRPAADIDAIALALVKLARLATDVPEIMEIDINPLLADEAGVVALDARIAVTAGFRLRPAIKAYPAELEKTITLRDGQRLKLRPVRPEDAAIYRPNLEKCDPADIRMRFFGPLKTVPETLIARLTQIDYDREMCFLATPEEETGEIFGWVRVTSDPDNLRSEYAILVRSDWKGHGLGWTLMEEIIAYGRARGTGEIWGTILRENDAMIDIVRQLGFHITGDPDDTTLVKARLPLNDSAERQAAQ